MHGYMEDLCEEEDGTNLLTRMKELTEELEHLRKKQPCVS